MTALRITHIITGLSTGGAEMMLYKLVSRMDRNEFEIHLVSLMDMGLIGEKIQDSGVPVTVLGMKRGRPDPRMMIKLARWLRQDRPDIIQTWMYHADLIGGLAAKIAGGIPVIWNIRHSNLDPKGNKNTTLWTAKVCTKLSDWLPSKIVCCSHASEQVHTRLGYNQNNMVVIPNGFDLDVFLPDMNARKAIRKELALAEETTLVGLIARFNTQKDHQNFFQAAGLLHQNRPDVHFVLCGNGIDWKNSKLTEWIVEAEVKSVTHLLGHRSDIPSIQAALDISSSSSYGEGFPNVIGEAMACGVPCVVTDVGDSSKIVDVTGIVVPPRDPQALADGWGSLIEMGAVARRKLGIAARKRIQDNYSLSMIAGQYEDLYHKVVTEKLLTLEKIQ